MGELIRFPHRPDGEKMQRGVPVKGAAPRFHPKTVIPEVPVGQQLVKFHGQPAFISERGSDPLVGKTQFTERQIEDLKQLGRQHQSKMEADEIIRTSDLRLAEVRAQLEGFVKYTH